MRGSSISIHLNLPVWASRNTPSPLCTCIPLSMVVTLHNLHAHKCTTCIICNRLQLTIHAGRVSHLEMCSCPSTLRSYRVMSSSSFHHARWPTRSRADSKFPWETGCQTESALVSNKIVHAQLLQLCGKHWMDSANMSPQK